MNKYNHINFFSVNKLSIILIYITIFFLLISPDIDLPQNMIGIGNVNIYLFEIPLLLTFILSFVAFLARKPFSISKNLFKTYSFIFIIALIGFMSALLHATVGLDTILKDFRYTLYWLFGVTLIFVGHKYLHLKTLTWVIASGLLAQILMAIVLVKTDPTTLFLHGFRFPIRSGWLTILFIAFFFMVITYKKKLLATGKYKIAPIAMLLVSLLLGVLLAQNRTTWIILFLMTTYWLFFYANVLSKLRFLMISVIFASIVCIVLHSIPYSADVRQNLYQRIFHKTLSSEGIAGTWEGNREVIYKSNFADFKKHPLLGNGFGHQMYIVTEDFHVENKSTSKVDNSFMNVLVKTGFLGFIIFTLALFNIYFTFKKAIQLTKNSQEWIYLKAMTFAFPFFTLASLNISILYGYPEVIIFSLFFAKAALMRTSLINDAEYRNKFATVSA